MPRWRVAGRRCSEYSETQRVRVDPLVRSRKIRFSSLKPYPGKTMAVLWAGVWNSARPRAISRGASFGRRQIQNFLRHCESRAS